MAIEILEKGSWHSYFDGMSKVLAGKEAHVDEEFAYEAHLDVAYAPLLGIVYDPRNDVLEVLLEGMHHTIAHVRQIQVDHDGINLHSVSVTDDEGVQQIIRLRDPGMLAAPPSADMASHP
jgi:hypothetical protein